MNKYLAISALIVALSMTNGFGEDRDLFFHTSGAGKADKTAAVQSQDENTVLEAGFLQQVSYSLGYDIISHIGSQIDLDMAYFLKGVADGEKQAPALTRDQMKQMLLAYQRLARQKAREAAKVILEENLAKGNVFLEGNKLKEGVITLSSGLQYQVIKEGTGPIPGENSTVECHYRGTLLDGTVFDSSYARGRPAVFQVDTVIAGWSQALMRMPVGSKWMLFIPADLAYGKAGAGDAIGPGETLIFEVELLGILDQE
jgi:FKBP-type peptidyl-prolyl cis-trans isomerase FklB